MAHIAGLVAAGVHPSPVPHSDFVTTTTHKTLRGPRGGLMLCQGRAREGTRQGGVPRRPGRPADAHHRGQGRVLQGSGRTGFGDYQRQIVRNAARLAEVLAGHGFRLVSGGTDNHLMLVDVFSQGHHRQGRRGSAGKAGITVNKNAIPFDKNPPMVASGIRDRHAGRHHARHARAARWICIGDLIARVLASPDDDGGVAMVRTEVETLCRAFPLYPDPAA